MGEHQAFNNMMQNQYDPNMMQQHQQHDPNANQQEQQEENQYNEWPKMYNGVQYWDQASFDAAMGGGSWPKEFNGVLYYNQADYDTAVANYGGGGGGGTETHTFSVGATGFNQSQTETGTNGTTDTFVISLGNFGASGSTSSIDTVPGPGTTLMAMAGMNEFDSIGNFEAGTDKIKIFGADGTTPITSLTAAGLTSTPMMGGMYFLHTADNDVVVGYMKATAFDDSDLTTV